MPDTSFGNNGVATITSPGNSTLGSSISLQPNGKIVTGGYIRTDSGTASYLIGRFSSDGTLDTTFAENGLKSIAIGGTTTYSFNLSPSRLMGAFSLWETTLFTGSCLTVLLTQVLMGTVHALLCPSLPSLTI